jgi:hypothetical protein
LTTYLLFGRAARTLSLFFLVALMDSLSPPTFIHRKEPFAVLRVPLFVCRDRSSSIGVLHGNKHFAGKLLRVLAHS